MTRYLLTWRVKSRASGMQIMTKVFRLFRIWLSEYFSQLRLESYFKNQQSLS